MLPYFAFWTLFAFAALGSSRRFSSLSQFVLILLLTFFIGFRDRVGGDWFNYFPRIASFTGAPLTDVFQQNEFFYALLNWIGGNIGGSIYFVNTVCGLIFSAALVFFCRYQPRPWLALSLAFPYLIMVVAMGYSRQGVAIGLEMVALLALQNGRLFQFLIWIFFASSFHAPVLVLLILPIVIVSGSGRSGQFLRLLLLVGSAYGIYSAAIAPEIDYYLRSYVEAEYQSQGAWVRVVLSLIPALVFLVNRRYFQLSVNERRTWTLLSLMSVASFILLFTGVSSTAIDRMALYLIPLQLFVGCRIPDIRPLGVESGTWNLILISLSFLVLSIWLLFAANAYAWTPYRNLLFFY